MSSPERQVWKHPQAREDIVELFSYLARRNERAARRFLKDVRTALELLARMPGVGHVWHPPIPRLPELRLTTISRRFRDYVIFYRIAEDGDVYVLRLVHGARDLPPIADLIGLDEE